MNLEHLADVLTKFVELYYFIAPGNRRPLDYLHLEDG